MTSAGAAPSILLREFTAADIPAALALWRATPGVGLSRADEPAALERFLRRNPGLSLAAEQHAGQGGLAVLVGTLLCGHDGRRGLIHHLVTAPAARRQGVARRMLNAALAGLAAEGIDRAHLLVYRSNADGLAFWRSVQAIERVELALWSVNVAATHAG
ncbi:MAG: hypothetical protein RIQ60_322 [Pseudomonadota bacterium]